MLSPKQQQYAEQLQVLVEESQQIANAGEPSEFEMISWFTKAQQLIETALGTDSLFYRYFVEAYGEMYIYNLNPEMIVSVAGILEGALGALKGGYLADQQLLMAADFFNSVLQQATELNRLSYKDPAAVLARVALEDVLRRLAASEAIPDVENKKASVINTELRTAGVYPKPLWRQVQAWLDIGNAAAHGEFEKYTQDNVTRLIEGVELFIATQLQP